MEHSFRIVVDDTKRKMENNQQDSSILTSNYDYAKFISSKELVLYDALYSLSGAFHVVYIFFYHLILTCL